MGGEMKSADESRATTQKRRTKYHPNVKSKRQRGANGEEEKERQKGIVLTSADFLAHQLPQHVSAAPSNTLALFHQASQSTGGEVGGCAMHVPVLHAAL